MDKIKKYKLIKIVRDLSLLMLVLTTIFVFYKINFSTLAYPTPEDQLNFNLTLFVFYVIISLLLTSILIGFTIILLRHKENIQIDNELETEVQQ